MLVSALKQPVPEKQLISVTDTNFRSDGYALMIEDNPDEKIQSKRKTNAYVAIGWKNSPLRNSRCPYTQKNFGQSTWLFSTLHIFCGKQQNQQLF